MALKNFVDVHFRAVEFSREGFVGAGGICEDVLTAG